MGGSKELFKILSEARQAADLIAPEAANAEPIDGAQLCNAHYDEQGRSLSNHETLA